MTKHKILIKNLFTTPKASSIFLPGGCIFFYILLKTEVHQIYFKFFNHTQSPKFAQVLPGEDVRILEE